MGVGSVSGAISVPCTPSSRADDLSPTRLIHGCQDIFFIAALLFATIDNFSAFRKGTYQPGPSNLPKNFVNSLPVRGCDK